MKIILGLVFFILFVSCSKIIPAKFWSTFHQEKIISEKSNQGPYGGTVEIVWNLNDRDFKTDEILNFAKENGWVLIDSSFADNFAVKSVVGNLTFDIIQQENLIKDEFLNSKIYIFETDKLRFKAGTDESTQNNGFIILNNENTKMKVFNIWGE